VAVDQWRWQPDSTLLDPDAAWWALLARATHGLWRAAGDAPAAGAMRLEGRRGSEQVGRLWLEPDSVLWCGRTPPCQRAPLSAQGRRGLLERLAR
jgi:hypothetical protein